MIMFLTPRKTPLVKKDKDDEQPVVKAVRTITAPPRAARAAGKPNPQA